jgi:hypothetical protein
VLALTNIDPATVEFAAGLVTATVGSGLSTLTTAAALTVDWLAPVVALAVSECLPDRPVAFHTTEIVHVG